MDTKFDFGGNDPARIAYVRSVAVIDLPEDMREQADGIETIYAVHAEDGTRLALVKDRSMAFSLARQNEMVPVAVH